ncbi:hypothetical protein, partial [Pseudomonas syringae]
MDQLSLLSGAKKLSELPSAKLKKADKLGRHGWINFYAAYSENFVDYALECLGVTKEHTVLD